MPLAAVLGFVLSATPSVMDLPAVAAPVPGGSPSTTARAPASSTTVTTTPGSDLGTLIADPGFPGFTAAAPGPTNGPLTAETFAAQSSDPAEAQAQFTALAARPGFGASIRLWNDTSGPGKGANDLAVLLFRIGDPAAARLFAAGLVAPYQAPGSAVPFDVPSIPGAVGATVTVTQPVEALEQVVVFATGPFVTAIQAASSAAPANTARISPTETIDVAYLESASVRRALPPKPPPVRHRAPPPAVPADTRAAALRPSWGRAGLLAALAVVAGVTGWGAARRRRRSGAVDAMPDPWGPGGVLTAFGAVTPDPAGARPGRPRSVPELVSTPLPEGETLPGRGEHDLPPPPSSLRSTRFPVR